MKKLVIVALLSSAVTYYVSSAPAPVVNEVTHITVTADPATVYGYQQSVRDRMAQISEERTERRYQNKISQPGYVKPAYVAPLVNSMSREDLFDLL